MRHSPAEILIYRLYKAGFELQHGRMAKALTLRVLLDRYGTEQACVDRLTQLLWPTGVKLPKLR